MARTHRIAIIDGDGVGKEVIPAGLDVLRAACAKHGASLDAVRFPWGSDHFHEHGCMMPDDALATLRDFDAVYFGAIGGEGVPEHLSGWGLHLQIRRGFNLYVNHRPIRLFDGVSTPLANRRPSDIDMVIVRENVEGEYTDAGGSVYPGSDQEIAVQTSIFSYPAIERVARYAFDLARTRKGHVSMITKSNALPGAYLVWDRAVSAVGAQYPDVALERVYVDAAAAYMVSSPTRFDVLLCSNLFGDILSDLGAALQGSIGLGASANINPIDRTPGLFEPAHGSAPDIAGRGLANPIGAVWSGALMLDYLGEAPAAASVMEAIETVLREPRHHTGDLGGKATTHQIRDALIDAIGSR